jgi:DNA-binding winged helix-turn-helix (wHTH) protein/tetratricopeptide (TPR) repeat protein
MHPAVPRLSALFVGRDAELARLREKLEQVPIAVIYGVAGIGKSTLACALAASWDGPVAYRKAGDEEPVATLLDDVRRQLAGGPVSEAATDDERLQDLVERMDATRALWLLDDLHRVEAAPRAALLRALGQSLRSGRLVATSRELLLIDPGGPDRLDLRLEGLDFASARSLWTQLDELYGPTEWLTSVWARSAGNPFLVRRAHAGGLAGDNPIATSLRELSDDERYVAGALALADVHLPAAVLAGLLSPDRASRALHRLVARLIADVDAAGSCTVHDVYREHIDRELSAEERRSLHEHLARLLRDAPVDPVVRVREVCRHLRALERWQEAGTLLVEQGADLVRLGAAGEMLRALEAIPREHRSPEVQVARARGLVRVLDLPRACDELERLVSAGIGPEQELKLTYGQVAMLTGHLDVASRVLGELQHRSWAVSELRIRALTAWALTLAHQGRSESAREHLVAQEELARGGDPLLAGSMALCRAHLFWLEERDAEALGPMNRARHLLLDVRPSSRAAVMAPATFAGVLARLGRLDEAAEALRTAETVLARHDDPLLRAEVRAMRACVLYERGDREEARAELLGVAEVFQRGGCLVGELWARAWLGRALLVIGRRRQGTAVLDETRARALAAGMASVALAVERGRTHDVLYAAGHALPVPLSENKRGEVVRARVLEGLRAASAGDARLADALLRPEALPAGGGYALDRALAHLARSLAARVQRRAGEAAVAVARANEEAEAGGVDPDLVPALLEMIGKRRLVVSTSHSLAAETPGEVSDYDVVLDGRTHLLRLAGREVTLARRPALRRLLYTLAEKPGASVSKEILARSLWSGQYHPLVHDNPLRVNILRLRALLGKAGLAIEVDEAGYRLSVPERFLYIEPLEPESNAK